MPNKYNLETVKVKFVPNILTSAPTKIAIIEIENSYKKEPVMQMVDNNDIKLLYYFSRIYIYQLNDTKFFAIEFTCDKNPEIYIVYNVEINTTAPTNNSSTIANIINGISGGGTTAIELDSNFNNDLRNKTIQRSGNVLYAGKITTSYTFPFAANATATALPQTLKELTSAPTQGGTVAFVQDEIQWVLDCKSLGEDGSEKVNLVGDKTNFAYFIGGISTIVGILLIYLFIKWINPSNITSTNTSSKTSFFSSFKSFFTGTKVHP